MKIPHDLTGHSAYSVSSVDIIWNDLADDSISINRKNTIVEAPLLVKVSSTLCNAKFLNFRHSSLCHAFDHIVIQKDASVALSYHLPSLEPLCNV